MDNHVRWLGAAALLALTAGPAGASHSWSNYHWALPATVAEDGHPFEVYTRLTQGYWRQMLVDDVNRDIIREIVAGWDDAAGKPSPNNVTFRDYLKPTLVGATPGDPKKCDPLSSKIVICSASYGFRGWLGIATVWTSGGHIVQATTKLNESYHNSGTYGSYSWRAAVACQEVGHDFGLGHQDEDFNTDATNSCMEYTSNPAGNETPDWHDFEQLETIYDAHVDGTETSSGGGRGGGRGGAASDPFVFREVGRAAPTNPVISEDWGAAIGYDAHGRPNVFERELRPGYRKITHVTWVPGFRPERHHMHDD